MAESIQKIQERMKPTAQAAAELAAERCGHMGWPLSGRQIQIVRGAVFNVLVGKAVERQARFAEAVVRGAKRVKELEELDTDDLADLLVDGVWSQMKESEESNIVEAAIERLRLLSA